MFACVRLLMILLHISYMGSSSIVDMPRDSWGLFMLMVVFLHYPSLIFGSMNLFMGCRISFFSYIMVLVCFCILYLV